MGAAATPSSGPDWDGHLLLLYSTEAERRASLTAWVRRGLDRGEKVVCTQVPTQPRHALVSLFEESGLESLTAMAEGRLTVLPLDEVWSADRQAGIVRQALAEGFPAVRMSAEADAASGIFDADAFLDIERATDALCRTRPLSAMCQYDLRKTTGHVLSDAVGVHLTGIRHAHLTTRADGDALVLHGEVDIANAHVLAAAVQAATTCISVTADSGPGVLRLELGPVRFIDVAACRALVEASRHFRQAGGSVRLLGPQPQVERTLRVLGLDGMAGLHIDEGTP